MIRLGLCCLFVEETIRFRRTTATHLLRIKSEGKDVLAYLHSVIDANIHSLFSAIAYCAQHDIGAFRISSQLMPVATHPDIGYTLEDLPYSAELKNQIKACKEAAARANIRLSFHPDQFVILNSPRQSVVQKSIIDLEHHAYLAELLGATEINIHGGGGYGDKSAALHRLMENFSLLSSRVQERLTLENDDKVYTPKELLSVCKSIQIPFVYDIHHHRCLPDGRTIEAVTKEALSTWNREPLFHLSSPRDGWSGKQPFRHHDYIDIHDMPVIWKSIPNLTIDIEAKAKELAVEKLRKELLVEGWPLTNTCIA